MRITSGRLKGKKIFFPSSATINTVKPTEGMVKEALISILRPYLAGMLFLDLFAGSGAVGLEAYSNGAREVMFVERDRKMAESLKRTLTQWEIPGQVWVGDYRRYLDYFNRKSITFDVVFIDPPYHTYPYSRILEKINIPKLMKQGGWMVIERHYRSDRLTEKELVTHNLISRLSRKYGSTCLDVYRVCEPGKTDIHTDK